MSCIECKYFDEENSFCTHPEVWCYAVYDLPTTASTPNVATARAIISIGCDKKEEIEQ